MSDYIARDEVLALKQVVTTDDSSGNETLDVVTIEDVLEINPADVIERSDYIESQKEVMRLRALSHKVNQNTMQYEGMYKDLHRKIDNAILVLEREQNSEFWSSTFRDGIDYALKNLKKIMED